METMRDIGDEYQMTIRTLTEVDDILIELERSQKRDPATWMLNSEGGKKRPTRGALVSAVLLHFGQLPKAVQAAIVRDGISRYNALIAEAASPAPVDGNARPIVAPPTHPIDAQAQRDERDGGASAAPKRKRGNGA